MLVVPPKITVHQCCQVYSFDRKHMTFWQVVRSYGPKLGRTLNIWLFNTTVRMHCQKYSFLLLPLSVFFTLAVFTFIVIIIVFFWYLGVFIGCSVSPSSPLSGLPTLRIFSQKYGIQKMIHISLDFYTKYQNFWIFYGF